MLVRQSVSDQKPWEVWRNPLHPLQSVGPSHLPNSQKYDHNRSETGRFPSLQMIIRSFHMTHKFVLVTTSSFRKVQKMPSSLASV